MTPAQARADRPSGDRDCYVAYRTTSPPGDCAFGDPSGATTIALVGDSHAEAWFPAMQRIATQRHWRLLFYTKSECPFVGARVQLRSVHGAYVACDAWDDNVIDQLRADGPVDAVVVTHTSGYLGALLRPDGSWVRTRDSGGVWQAGFARTLRALAGVARKVVVLRDVPRPNGDLPACLAKHARDITSCQAPRKDAFFNALYDAEHAAADDRTAFVDLDDVLCPGDPCPVVWWDGTVMYRDSHHMTASLSVRLAPLLGSRLAAVLTGTSTRSASRRAPMSCCARQT
jgi:SGNH domain (fused to AT3 domains)